MAVKKVILNGQTIIDLSDTTAVVEDVTQGKVFYKSNGDRAVGTNKGGGSNPSDISIIRSNVYERIAVGNGLSENFISTNDRFLPERIYSLTEMNYLQSTSTVVNYFIEDNQYGTTSFESNTNYQNYTCYYEKDILNSTVQYKVVNNNKEDITSDYLNYNYAYYCAYYSLTIDENATTALQQSYINQIDVNYEYKEELIHSIQSDIHSFILTFIMTDEPTQTVPPQPEEPEIPTTKELNIVGMSGLTYEAGETWGSWLLKGQQYNLGTFSADKGNGDINYFFNSEFYAIVGANEKDLIEDRYYFAKSEQIPTIDGVMASDPSLISFTINNQTYKSDVDCSWSNWVSSAYNNSGYVLYNDDSLVAIKMDGPNGNQTIYVVGNVLYGDAGVIQTKDIINSNGEYCLFLVG